MRCPPIRVRRGDGGPRRGALDRAGVEVELGTRRRGRSTNSGSGVETADADSTSLPLFLDFDIPGDSYLALGLSKSCSLHRLILYWQRGATEGRYMQLLNRSDHILRLWMERERLRQAD